MLPDPREREAQCEGLQDGGVMFRDGPLGAGSRIGAFSTPDAPLTQAQSTYVRTNTCTRGQAPSLLVPEWPSGLPRRSQDGTFLPRGY